MRLAEIIYLCPDHGAVTPNSGACPFCAVEVAGYVPADRDDARLRAALASAQGLVEEALDTWTWPIRDYSEIRPWFLRLIKALGSPDEIDENHEEGR